MSSVRFAFQALQKKIEPDSHRKELASVLPGEVRDWLTNHEFPTALPHTLLNGSYARSTAIGRIPDVDVLVFVPSEALESTPRSIRSALRQALDEYPDALVETRLQRRSVRLSFEYHELYLDLVPSVWKEAEGGPILIPDRSAGDWIESDPVGYGRRLASVNQEHSRAVVPLIKLLKAWRDTVMVQHRVKSYLLEVILLGAVETGDLELRDKSSAKRVRDFFEDCEDRWGDLMDRGSGVPRVLDPQLGNSLTTEWTRAEFETFMRRIRDSLKIGDRALGADDDEDALEEWARLFGDFWPTSEEIETEARNGAKDSWPGVAAVTAAGNVVANKTPASIPSRQTVFHGGVQQ